MTKTFKNRFALMLGAMALMLTVGSVLTPSASADANGDLEDVSCQGKILSPLEISPQCTENQDNQSN